MATLGFIVMVILSIGASALPLFLIGLSGLGGGMKKGDWCVVVGVWTIAAILWWFTISSSPFSVNYK